MNAPQHPATGQAPQVAAGDPKEEGVEPDAEGFQPLEGEAGPPHVATRKPSRWSRKGLLAVGLLMLGLAAVIGVSIVRATSGPKKSDPAETRAANKPMTVTREPRRLDLAVAAPSNAARPASASATSAQPLIPALATTPDDPAQPIAVRRTPSGGPPNGGTPLVSPEDAPVMLVTARPGALAGREPTARPPVQPHDMPPPDAVDPGTDPLAGTRQNLDHYQQQLRGLMDNLTKSAVAATGASTGVPSIGVPPSGLPPTLAGSTPAGMATAAGGLFGGPLQGPSTPRVMASQLPNRSLTLPKGTAFTCALKTRIVSAASGLVGCMVQRNVYGDDGRVLLIERGSHLDGEYRIGSVRPGMVRIPVVWTRVRTPLGVTVELESPGTGPLGEAGVDGYVDNRWPERIGAAMLLSLIDDSVKLVIQNQANERTGDTIVLPSTTSNTSKLAEKVLDSTINIPPLIYQNQGGIVGIVVARDVDFSSVYELQAVSR